MHYLFRRTIKHAARFRPLHQIRNLNRVQILELEPGIAYLGESFAEAAELKNQHLEAMTNLKTKQSPVEELLRQADDLIANQKPKAEVYSAMAESLGQAWRDLNYQLEQRREILDQNYSFQGHFHVRSKFSSIS